MGNKSPKPETLNPKFSRLISTLKGVLVIVTLNPKPSRLISTLKGVLVGVMRLISLRKHRNRKGDPEAQDST